MQLGCGSGELLRAAVQAFTSPTKALVSPEPTFESPANFAKFVGHPVVSPKVDSKLQLDLNAMTDAARGAGLVYFCNSNNPTATVHGKSDVAMYVEQVNRASPETTILIDEAYHEYVEDPTYEHGDPDRDRQSARRRHANVLEGVRDGGPAARLRDRPAGHAQEDVVWLLGSNTNQLVLAAAAATMADKAHIADEVRKNKEARAFARKFFESAGYTVHAADANFFMVDVRRDAKAFKLECVKHSVAIGRQFPALPNHARISVGTMAEMQKAVPVFRTVLASNVSTSQQR